MPRLHLKLTLLVAIVVWASALPAQDMALSGVLIDGEDWQLVAEGFKFTEGPAVDAEGNVFFTDIPHSRIHKIDAGTGKVSLFAENTGGANGLMFGPDGRLYACQNEKKQIGAFDAQGRVEVIASEVQSNDLVVAANGAIFFTDPPGGKVWHISPEREKKVVAEGLKPNGLVLWRQGGTLVVTDGMEANLWTFRVEAGGALTGKERYYGPLQLPTRADRPGSDGMTIDAQGRLYVTTRAGLQVFDPIGRLSGSILKPHAGPLSNVCFGGKDLKTLYVTAGDKVYKRNVQASGFRYGMK